MIPAMNRQLLTTFAAKQLPKYQPHRLYHTTTTPAQFLRTAPFPPALRHQHHNNTPTVINTMKYNHNAFRKTNPLRDWKQVQDHKNGGFYYKNIFTDEITRVQPAEFIPHTYQGESAGMTMLRNDGVDVVKKKQSWKVNLTKVVVITTALYVLDATGVLPRMFGAQPPPPPPPLTMDHRVVENTKKEMKQYTDYLYSSGSTNLVKP